ncbi:MAG TPA: hypothetical protein PLT92_08595 [Ignavibacteriaceae bacterium]|jgi:hypothetical protein|nr:hypothetical protein [Ignavibacteriaceae bacterium]HOJ18604.1 hypothetical protein [Ignavibacteriaceae bacterium]
MKKVKSIVLFFIFGVASLYSQSDIRLSMGLNFASSPQLREYINYSAPTNDLQPDVSTYIEFAGEYGYEVSKNYQIGIEGAYESKTVNYPGAPSSYEFNYSLLMPSFTGYYIMKEASYKFKFGVGLGPRFAIIDEAVYTKTSTRYTASGFGLLLKADGSTKLSELVYAYIGLDIRYNNIGELKSKDNILLNNPNSNEGVSFNSFSAGIKLGVAVIL